MNTTESDIIFKTFMTQEPKINTEYIELLPPTTLWGGCLLYTSDAADE